MSNRTEQGPLPLGKAALGATLLVVAEHLGAGWYHEGNVRACDQLLTGPGRISLNISDSSYGPLGKITVNAMDGGKMLSLGPVHCKPDGTAYTVRIHIANHTSAAHIAAAIRRRLLPDYTVLLRALYPPTGGPDI